MNIDPEAQKFSEFYKIDEEKMKEVEEKIQSGEIPIVARSNSELNLRMLQDDLRKAGYKKVK